MHSVIPELPALKKANTEILEKSIFLKNPTDKFEITQECCIFHACDPEDLEVLMKPDEFLERIRTEIQEFQGQNLNEDDNEKAVDAETEPKVAITSLSLQKKINVLRDKLRRVQVVV